MAQEREVFARLRDAAHPADRAAILRELATAARGGLDLGGDLDGFAELGAISVPDLRLRRARLAFADLRAADLSGAFLAQADLNGAKLERADLSRADLSHADCAGAHMGEARLELALMEEGRFDRASLRFADMREAAVEGGSLVGADLWGARLDKADFSGADLRDARIGEAFAPGADFSEADLRGATFINTDLSGADFRGADLRGVHFKGAMLRGANLADAQVQEVDLTTCELADTRWSGARLDRTSLRQDQLRGTVGEEKSGDFDAAARSYRALERNFEGTGDPEAASWAYRRRRRMQKQAARHKAKEAMRVRHWVDAAANMLSYISDQLVEWICDYGESVGRVLAALALVYVGFTALYGFTDSITRVSGTTSTVTHDPLDLALFSLMAMTTSGTPSMTLMPSHVYALYLSGIQALLGIFLTGLLGFVAGNRIRR